MTNAAIPAHLIFIAENLAQRMRRMEISANEAVVSAGGLEYLDGHDKEVVMTRACELNGMRPRFHVKYKWSKIFK